MQFRSETGNDYSSRRRRNIVLSDSRNLNQVGDIDKGIKWENNQKIDDDFEVDLEEGEELEEVEDFEDDSDEYEVIELENNEEDDESELELVDEEIEQEEMKSESIKEKNFETDIENMLIGNKKLNLSKFNGTAQHEEVEKITIYLNKNLIMIMKMLKNGKKINSYSQFVKEAIEKYLTT